MNELAEATPLRRSLLFVPGAELRKLERAREAKADTLLLDLEDAVAPEQKEAARAHVATAVRSGAFGAIETAVRVNAPSTPYFEDDVEAVIEAGCRLILLPKAESATGIAAVEEKLRNAERRCGRGGTRLLLLVESPRGIAEALALGRASSRIGGLCFGHADFSLSMGLSEADASRGVAYHARCSLVIAAKACDVAPIDTVFLAAKDEAGFRADAELGMQLGFDGKLCIHPRQAEIANEVYTPTAAQIDYASSVIDASQRAEAEGRGVFTLSGKMIDAPIVAVQRRVLERARRAGILAGTSSR